MGAALPERCQLSGCQLPGRAAGCGLGLQRSASGALEPHSAGWCIPLPQFNLMACIEDRRQKYGRELAAQRRLQARLRAKLGGSAPPEAPEGCGDDAPLPDDPDTLAARLSESEAEAAR